MGQIKVVRTACGGAKAQPSSVQVTACDKKICSFKLTCNIESIGHGHLKSLEDKKLDGRL